MVEIFRSVCPLNCYASCGLLVHREKGRIVKITGDPEHPVTKGLICKKGRMLLERLYHPERILHPLQKTGGGWRKISWDQALDLIAENLTRIKEESETTAVFHHYFSGSNGVLRGLDQRFFNAYGGVTRPTGCLCWGSGIAAQQYDFGGVQMHEWADCLNAKTILLWGRDPEKTNIHLVPILKKAVARGANLVVINPIRNHIAGTAQLFVSPRPGTDGALALGVANLILQDQLEDPDFIRRHTHGFEAYAQMVQEYTPERVSQITGVPRDSLLQLARLYAEQKPACIFLGMGLQRYANGGQTIRAIDALGAITGNIGIPGGGINYGHKTWKGLLNSITGEEMAQRKREFIYPVMAQALLDATEPPVRTMFVTRSNPVCQNPNSGKVVQAMNKVDFKVVVDYFLTDTAELADLVLPCTTQFEEEDLMLCSSNHYLSYAPKIVEPAGEARPEPEIYRDLAGRLKLTDFGDRDSTQWLEYALKPAEQYGITLERLKAGVVRNPLATEVAWENHSFPTPSGRYEFFSEKAREEGLPPLPVYLEPEESLMREDGIASQYPLHFLTPHHPNRTHSQFGNLEASGARDRLPPVDIHPDTAKERNIREGDTVLVFSQRGEITAEARLTADVRPDVIRMYAGSWKKNGGGVNFLTMDRIADMGNSTPHYDCLCQVRKVESGEL